MYVDIIYSFVLHVLFSARHEEAHNGLTTKYALENKGGKGTLKLAQFLEFLLLLYRWLIEIKMSNSALL